jgi:hypothetical protein
MVSGMARIGIIVLIVLGSGLAAARGDEHRPAIAVRLHRPRRQGEQLLELFQGAPASSPAAALAAWKLKTNGSLSKRTEALIALVNPDLVRELGTFDESSAAIDFARTEGRLRWHVSVPHDDGTFAALATALVLTDGDAEPPLGSTAVDRLGPSGAPVAASQGRRFVLASSRETLQNALGPPTPLGLPEPSGNSGLQIVVDPDGLARSKSLTLLRIAEPLRALGYGTFTGWASLENETLLVELRGKRNGPALPSPAIRADWFDFVPAALTAAVASFALDARPEALERAFAAADRIERADPARSGVAPLRTRLNLIALTAKVQPEVDLWPLLRGVTMLALADDNGGLAGSVLLIHASDDAAAARIERNVLRRAAALWATEQGKDDRNTDRRPPVRLAGRALSWEQRGPTIAVGWGDGVVERCLDAKDHPERSAGRTLRERWPSAPQRAGAFWPGRLSAILPHGTPLARALADAPPIRWEGRTTAGGTHDVIRWPELRGLVHRFLKRLPLP